MSPSLICIFRIHLKSQSNSQTTLTFIHTIGSILLIQPYQKNLNGNFRLCKKFRIGEIHINHRDIDKKILKGNEKLVYM